MILSRCIFIDDPSELKTGLLACWEFEEPSGITVYDSHTNTYNLLNQSATVNQTGKISKAYLYNGTASRCLYNAASNNLDPISNHSISMWVNRTGNGKGVGWLMLISKYWSTTNYRVYVLAMFNTGVTNENRIQWAYWDSGNTQTNCNYDPGSDIWTNNWKHIVVTRSGKNLKTYVNGILVATSSGGNGNMKQQTTTVKDYIGCAARSSTTPDLFFKGLIDQTAVWSVALTQGQVTTLYNEGNGLVYSSWI